MDNVLEIIGKLSIGGAEKVAAEIGFHADNSKYCVHYIVFGDDVGEYEDELQKKGCLVFHLPPPSSNYYAYVSTLVKLTKQYRYKVIHAHTMFNSGWAMLVGKIHGVPIRITHSHSKNDPLNHGIKKKTYNHAMRFLIRTCSTHYIGCGKAAGEWMFGKSFFAEHGEVICNGIDTQKNAFNVQEREILRRNYNIEDNYVIGHVGRLSHVKNQSFLIRLIPELLKTHDVRLVLVGDGEDRKELETLAEKEGVKDKVIMVGSVLDAYRYFNMFDVFAFPSYNEGTPLSLIESQANGLHCIISENIPDDTFVTDLIHICPLSEEDVWIKNINIYRRKESERYASVVFNAGLDITTQMEKIYRIFEGEK